MCVCVGRNMPLLGSFLFIVLTSFGSNKENLVLAHIHTLKQTYKYIYIPHLSTHTQSTPTVTIHLPTHQLPLPTHPNTPTLIHPPTPTNPQTTSIHIHTIPPLSLTHTIHFLLLLTFNGGLLCCRHLRNSKVWYCQLGPPNVYPLPLRNR